MSYYPPSTLKALVAEIAAALISEKTKKGCENAWNNHLDRLKKYPTTNGTITDNTLRQSVSEVRRALNSSLTNTATHIKLRNWLLEAPIKSLDGSQRYNLGIVVVGEAIAQRSNEGRKNSLLESVSNTSKIEGISQLIKDCENLLKSWDYKDVAAAIALLTGRRTIEVLKTGTFTPKGSNLIKFEGQAKTKKSPVLIIPSLVNSKKIAAAVAHLRKLKDFSNTSFEQINTDTQKALERHVNKLVKPYTDDKATMHDLRKIYATHCVNTVMGNVAIKDENGNVANNARVFLQLILGHENTATGLHYETWEVK
jgi:integrase